MIDAALRQGLPTGDGQDVAAVVCTVLGADTDYAAMVPDIESRIASGEKKYGTRLKTYNGRNVDLDLYQEILDGLNYSMQAYLQTQDSRYTKIFYGLARLGAVVKAILAQEENNVNQEETQAGRGLIIGQAAPSDPA